MIADEEEAELRKEEKFYEMVGHCVLRYQHVEDYLETIFAVTLGGPAKRAEAIYACVRGVGPKTKLIEAAATGRDDAPWDGLASLLSRVREVSEVRNHIAHARPVSFHSYQVLMRTERGLPVETVSIEPIAKRMELRKQAAKTTVVYTIDDLWREYRRFHTLLDDMITFVRSVD